MRFATATTALLLANGGAFAETQQQSSKLRGNLQSGNPNENANSNTPHQRKLNNYPIVNKLLRRLANKKQEQAMSQGSDEAPLLAGNGDVVSPDLGVIGNRKHRRASKDRSNRALDETEDGFETYSLFLLDAVEYICEQMSDEEGNNAYCDCGNFDFEAVNGTVECSYYTQPDGSDTCQSTINYCGETVEICLRDSVILEASDPETYTYTGCYTYSKPYQQHVCVTFDHTSEDVTPPATVVPTEAGAITFTNPSSAECSSTFNNMECNSCETQIKTTQQNSFNSETGGFEVDFLYQERCFQIDCSNIGDGSNIVNTCDIDSLPTTLKENVVFGDDCSRCQPCGLGYHVQNPDAEGIFPVIGEYQCSGVELAAKIGLFDRGLCPEIQEKMAEYCGCEPLFFDPTLVWSPPTETPPTETRTKMTSTSFENSYGLPVLLPGDTIGDKTCNVCVFAEAVVANPHKIVTLPNGVMTSCAALQGAGQLGMFTSEYCRAEVMPLVFRTCGGCFQNQELNIVPPESIVAQPPEEEETDPLPPIVDEEVDIADPEPEEETSPSTGEEVVIANPEPEEETTPSSEVDESTPTFPIFDEEVSVADPDSVEEMTPSSPTFVVGEDIVSCQICDNGSELGSPDKVFTLSEEEISCKDFEERLKNSALSESFCLEEASEIADIHCGGCVVKRSAIPSNTSQDSSSTNIASYGIISSRKDDGEPKQKLKSVTSHHNERPEELDVKSDPSTLENLDEEKPVVTNAVITDESSSQSLIGASKTWVMLSTAMAISSSVVVYFS